MQTVNAAAAATDYLAIINVNGVGSYGRASDKTKAVDTAMRIFRADFGKLLGFKKGAKIVVNVIDATGHDKIAWGDFGFTADGKPFEPKIEIVNRNY